MRVNADVDLGAARLKLLRARGLAQSDVDAILKRCGLYLVASTQRRFRNQQEPSGKRWAPRQTPNVMGILSDLRGGGNPKSRRFADRPAVIDTGRLRNSINYRQSGTNSVVAGTRTAYASLQNYGGRSEKIAITSAMKERLSKWLRKNEEHKETLGFLFRRKSHSVNVLARKFLGISREDATALVKIVRAELFKLGQGGGDSSPNPKMRP